MTKHLKPRKPTDADLQGNPLIGGAKGTTMAGVTPDELEASEGANTIEGDVANDTNPQGGVERIGERRGTRRRRAQEGRTQPSRRPLLQGEKTHEQQLRILERKPDLPDWGRSEAGRWRGGSAPPDELPVGPSGRKR